MNFLYLVAFLTDQLMMAMLFLSAVKILAAEVTVLFFDEVNESKFLESFEDAIDCRGVDFNLIFFGLSGNFVSV